MCFQLFSTVRSLLQLFSAGFTCDQLFSAVLSLFLLFSAALNCSQLISTFLNWSQLLSAVLIFFTFYQMSSTAFTCPPMFSLVLNLFWYCFFEWPGLNFVHLISAVAIVSGCYSWLVGFRRDFQLCPNCVANFEPQKAPPNSKKIQLDMDLQTLTQGIRLR